VANRIWAELCAELETPAEKSEPRTVLVAQSSKHGRINNLSSKPPLSSMDEKQEQQSPPVILSPEMLSTVDSLPVVVLTSENSTTVSGDNRSYSKIVKEDHPGPRPTPSLEQLLAEENEEEITRVLDEMNADNPSQGDESSEHEDFDTQLVGSEFTGESLVAEISTGVPDEDPDTKFLEEMDEMTFNDLLQGLVMSPKEENVSAVELLQSKLAALKAQYSDILGSDIDIDFLG